MNRSIVLKSAFRLGSLSKSRLVGLWQGERADIRGYPNYMHDLPHPFTKMPGSYAQFAIQQAAE